MKPTPVQRKILRFVQLRARCSAESIAGESGLKTPTILRTLKRLRDEGLLVPRPLINYPAIGFVEYDLFLRVSGSTASSRKKLAKWAVAAGNVLVLAETGGEFQYEVVFVAKNPAEVVRSLNELQTALTGLDVERQIAMRTSYWLFGTKCLGTSDRSLPILGYTAGDSRPPITLDAVDTSLLAAIDKSPDYNVTRLARAIRKPASTLEYRLKRLEEAGVVGGYYFDYSALFEKIGLVGAHVLLRAKGGSAGFDKKFFRFCHEHHYIDKLMQSVGSWDYKLMVRVPSGISLQTVIDDIYGQFESSLAQIRLVPILRIRSVSGFTG